MERQITRRDFVSRMAAGAAGVSIVPRHVLGGPGYVAPSDRLHIAMVGAGGMGAENALNLVIGGQNIVALADVDFPHVDLTVAGKLRDGEGRARPEGEKLREAYAAAKRFHDYREMLDRDGENIDAVLIATPDHSHAPAASLAMRRGKHVYVQKPLTWSVREARVLNDLARRTGVVTQMGNQGHTVSADARRVNEWVQAGILGPVREVHVWTNRPIWPQGVPRPAEVVGRPAGAGWDEQGLRATLAGAMGGTHPVPGHLAWDLFLGPAPEVEYHPIYHPESLVREAEQVPQTYPRFETSHEMNWVNAIRGEAEATSPFSYSAPLTEVMLLGLVALRAGQGVKIAYDGRTGRTDSAEANRFLHREYRRGWDL